MLIVDCGPLVATADRDDPDHDACTQLLESDTGGLVTTAMVIAEAAYLIARRGGPAAEAALYRSIINGEMTVEPLGRSDWVRIAELVDTYSDLGLGGTDASVIAVAERLDVATVATLDRRHFTVVRPANCDAFQLLPQH
ncbi:MAG: PIN domain-containing protein [Acidimicrobiia bacterium]|nr:PIN domain-containing protein [Acidimicrobiia bacterium]